MAKSDLVLDFVGRDAVKHACSHWHYSNSFPPPPHVALGVWECNEFVGVVLFARGACSKLMNPYGLDTDEGAELVRVALRDHVAPVSRIMAIATILLRRRCPELKLLVSFADPHQRHHGGIYQACGWTYLGTTMPSSVFVDAAGREWHSRMISSTGVRKVFGKHRRVTRKQDCTEIRRPGKHRYVLGLTDEMRAMLHDRAKPYPKRVTSADSGTPGDQPGGGGASPTVTLSTAGAIRDD
jgi:hypothetical protein